MTTKKTVQPNVVVRGDFASRKNELRGPYDIFLPTNNVGPDGKYIMESYVDPITNEDKQRRELEKESFVTIWFRKNYATPGMEEAFREQRISEEFTEEQLVETGEFKEYVNDKGERVKEPIMEKRKVATRGLYATVHTVVRLVGKWDATFEGEPIPLTVEAVMKADPDRDILYAILNKHTEVYSPPKE
jgi:hypothetical protein